MAKSKRQKYILSLIGAIIYQIGMSSITIMGLLSVYITSYIQLNQKWVTMHYGLFLQPILTLCTSSSSPLGGYIENKIGFHYSIILSNIIFFIGIFGLYMTQNIWLCYFFFLIIGISNFSLKMPAKNVLFYAPNSKGIITAILAVVLSVFSSLFGFIGESIINEDSYTLKEEETIYPDYISIKTPNFYIIQIISIPACSLISFLFIYIYHPSIEDTFQNKKVNEKENENENNMKETLNENIKQPQNDNIKISQKEKGIQNENTNSVIKTNTNNNTSNIQNSSNEEKIKKDEKYKSDIKKAIKSKQFWLLCGIAFCVSFIINFILLTFRTFGALIGISGETFKFIYFAFTVSTLVCNPIWGLLIDKFGSKIILKIICLGCTSLGILLFFSVNSSFIFILSIILAMVFINGFGSAMNPHIMEIFSIKYSL